MRLLLPLLILAGCTTPKTWQEACFKNATPTQPSIGGAPQAKVFDPVLDVREHDGHTLVYCAE